jgi:hypothetical protein
VMFGEAGDTSVLSLNSKNEHTQYSHQNFTLVI